MALTFSNPFPLGAQAPNFELPDVVSGKTYTLADFKSEKGLVVFFICSHCPYVKHYNTALSTFATAVQDLGLRVVAISSNDADAFPDDAPEKLKEQALQYKFPFPYLYDESQRIAKAYKASCTPDFYLFDADFACTYHGQFDASRPKNDLTITGSDLFEAVQVLLQGLPPLENQVPSSGCNIKWKAGVSPF